MSLVDIPLEIKNDLVYCQRALVNHILMHQRVSTKMQLPGKDSFIFLKKLNQIEEEIKLIGNDQKGLFNRLRLIIDLLLLNDTNVYVSSKTRKELTDIATLEIARYSEICGVSVKPMVVQERLNEVELETNFGGGPEPLDSPVSQNDHIDDYIRCMEKNQVDEFTIRRSSSVSSSDAILEVLSSDDALIPDEECSTPQQQTSQQSLLKPQAERLSTPKEEEEKKPPAPAIKLSRLKLKEALNKIKGVNMAKPASSALPAPNISTVRKTKRKTPSPDLKASTAKKIKPPSRSKSRSASRSKSGSPVSSDNTPEYPELPPEEPVPTEFSKDLFFKELNLCTHEYSDFLMSRRTERKRRNCTSTAREDFHYGKLDLFEKQYTKRNNTRQFLYSPPATRALSRKRRIPSGAKVSAAAVTAQSFRDKVSKAKSTNAASAKDNKEKVCVTCFKKDDLSKCATCQAAFHVTCHTNSDIELPMKIWQFQCQVCCLQLKKKGKLSR